MKLDAICNELVTNLYAKDDCISVIKLNPPYNLMVDLSKISSGRNLTTAAEPSLEPLYQLLVGYTDWCIRHDRIKRLICNAVKPDSVTATKYLV